MTILYPNACYKEMCNRQTALLDWDPQERIVLPANCGIKGQFYIEITGKRPSYGHFPIISL